MFLFLSCIWCLIGLAALSYWKEKIEKDTDLVFQDNKAISVMLFAFLGLFSWAVGYIVYIMETNDAN